MAKHSCKCFMLHLDKVFRILPNIKREVKGHISLEAVSLLIKPDAGGRCVKNQSRDLVLCLVFNKAVQWLQKHHLRRTPHLQSN